MKISVLIAANKAAAHIGHALASVREQVNAELEILVVEYGQPDNTEQIVRDFGQLPHQPVYFTRVADGSTAAACNRLLELATGDPVAFLNPTDLWTPRHLANAVQQLSEGADVVVSDIQYFDPKSGRALSSLVMPPQLTTNPTRTLFTRDAIPSSSCVVLRREVAERVGGFDLPLRVDADRDFWLRCALGGARFTSTHRASCHCAKPPGNDAARALVAAEHAVLFYEKHRDLAAVPAALRRRMLAASLVTHGRLLRNSDPARAARCFWRAWSLQPVHVQTLGQFALTGWRSTDGRRSSNPIGNETVGNGP